MKKIIYTLIILLLPLNIYALTYPELNSKKGLVYDLTDDKILYEKNSEEISSIASLTKIMTTITALENIEDLNEEITITKEMLNQVRWDASIAGLKVGDCVTYEDLLYASILPSGADATISIAVSTSGSVKNFTDKMNAKAQELGMNNTHYVNVTGLDAEGHYSTIKDVLTLLKYALQNPKFKEIYTTKSYTLSNNLTVYSTINTYNNTMHLDTSRILGSKTGFTNDAGYCMSALINSDNHDFLIILLNAERKNGLSYNLIDTLDLIDFIDQKYNNVELVKKGDIIYKIDIKNSKQKEYNIEASEDISFFLPEDYNKDLFKIEFNGPKTLSSNNKVGESIGTISYYYDNELLKEETIYLNTKIEFSFKEYLKNNNIIVIVMATFIIICLLTIIIFKKKRRK